VLTDTILSVVAGQDGDDWEEGEHGAGGVPAA